MRRVPGRIFHTFFLPIALYNLGRVLYAQDKPKEALQRFREAVEADSGYVDAWKDLGTLLYQGDRAEEAIREYRTAIRLDPGNAVAHQNLAIVLAQQEE